MTRIFYQEDDLFLRQEAGPWLRYDPLYDEIKEARHFEDESLSQGVWGRDLKKANWPLVEKLCYQALVEKTCDLQILGWLCESWVALDHWKGLQRSLKLLERYGSHFQKMMHPDDVEHRLHLLEWLDGVLSYQVLFCPLSQSAQDYGPLTLFQNRQMKAGGGSLTQEDFQKIMGGSHDFLKELKEDLLKVLQALSSLSEPQKAVVASENFTYPKLSKTLQEIFQILQTFEQEEPSSKTFLPNQESDTFSGSHTTLQSAPKPDQVVISGRLEAYAALSELTVFLKQVDPHSPIPPLLELIVSWKDKNLLEIIEDFQKGQGSAYHTLRFLALAPGK